jgi:hypothetical protein
MARKVSGKGKPSKKSMPAVSQVWLQGGGDNPGVVVAYITVGQSKTFYPELIRAHLGDVILWVVRKEDRSKPTTVRLSSFTRKFRNKRATSRAADPLVNLTLSRSAAGLTDLAKLVAVRVKSDNKYLGRYKYTIRIDGLDAIDPDLDVTPPHD